MQTERIFTMGFHNYFHKYYMDNMKIFINSILKQFKNN